jgi:hypothetical protein
MIAITITPGGGRGAPGDEHSTDMSLSVEKVA